MTEIDQPRNARSRRTRAALLDAALAILEEDGFDALTMVGVAERAGVSRRGAYMHFTSREDLVGALFEHAAQTQDLAGSLAPVREATNGGDALRAWASHLASYHPRMLAIDRAIEWVRHRDRDAAAHHTRVQEAQRDTCRHLAQLLADENRLAGPWTVTTATDMLWAQVSSEVIGGLLHDCGWSPTMLADHLAAMYEATFIA